MRNTIYEQMKLYKSKTWIDCKTARSNRAYNISNTAKLGSNINIFFVQTAKMRLHFLFRCSIPEFGVFYHTKKLHFIELFICTFNFNGNQFRWFHSQNPRNSFTSCLSNAIELVFFGISMHFLIYLNPFGWVWFGLKYKVQYILTYNWYTRDIQCVYHTYIRMNSNL